MFKTNNRIENEATALYSEHKNIVESIDQKNKYIIRLEEMKKLMANIAVSTPEVQENYPEYADSIDFDKLGVSKEINELDTESEANTSAAKSFVKNNPRLQNIAVKSARSNGVQLDLN
jgi:hypothetical protein